MGGERERERLPLMKYWQRIFFIDYFVSNYWTLMAPIKIKRLEQENNCDSGLANVAVPCQLGIIFSLRQKDLNPTERKKERKPKATKTEKTRKIKQKDRKSFL